ncbi:MAG: hypothetical protein JOY56_00570 [Solirubrobacterales bacterium]|nr:hypothetical protein [Solirubrobacterales bacterium]
MDTNAEVTAGWGQPLYDGFVRFRQLPTTRKAALGIHDEHAPALCTPYQATGYWSHRVLDISEAVPPAMDRVSTFERAPLILVN